MLRQSDNTVVSERIGVYSIFRIATECLLNSISVLVPVRRVLPEGGRELQREQRLQRPRASERQRRETGSTENTTERATKIGMD